MAKSIRDPKKSKSKVGRPKTTGPGEAQVVRMHQPQIDAIDEWMASQDAVMSRPEAIRRLVEIGLANAQSAKQLDDAKTHAGQAKKLAAELGLRAKK